ADSVLAGNGSALGDAEAQNLIARGFGTLQLARVVWIEEDDGVHVSIAGVENVTDREPMFLSNPLDVAQGGRDLSPRHHAILHIIGRTYAAHRAERVLTAFPSQLTLLRRSRDADLPRAAPLAGVFN